MKKCRSYLVQFIFIASMGISSFDAYALPSTENMTHDCLFKDVIGGAANVGNINCSTESDPVKFCGCVEKLAPFLNIDPETEMQKVTELAVNFEMFNQHLGDYMTLQEEMKKLNLLGRFQIGESNRVCRLEGQRNREIKQPFLQSLLDHANKNIDNIDYSQSNHLSKPDSNLHRFLSRSFFSEDPNSPAPLASAFQEYDRIAEYKTRQSEIITQSFEDDEVVEKIMQLNFDVRRMKQNTDKNIKQLVFNILKEDDNASNYIGYNLETNASLVHFFQKIAEGYYLGSHLGLTEREKHRDQINSIATKSQEPNFKELLDQFNSNIFQYLGSDTFKKNQGNIKSNAFMQSCRDLQDRFARLLSDFTSSENPEHMGDKYQRVHTSFTKNTNPQDRLNSLKALQNSINGNDNMAFMRQFFSHDVERTSFLIDYYFCHQAPTAISSKDNNIGEQSDPSLGSNPAGDTSSISDEVLGEDLAKVLFSFENLTLASESVRIAQRHVVNDRKGNSDDPKDAAIRNANLEALVAANLAYQNQKREFDALTTQLSEKYRNTDSSFFTEFERITGSNIGRAPEERVSEYVQTDAGITRNPHFEKEIAVRNENHLSNNPRGQNIKASLEAQGLNLLGHATSVEEVEIQQESEEIRKEFISDEATRIVQGLSSGEIDANNIKNQFNQSLEKISHIDFNNLESSEKSLNSQREEVLVEDIRKLTNTIDREDPFTSHNDLSNQSIAKTIPEESISPAIERINSIPSSTPEPPNTNLASLPASSREKVNQIDQRYQQLENQKNLYQKRFQAAQEQKEKAQANLMDNLQQQVREEKERSTVLQKKISKLNDESTREEPLISTNSVISNNFVSNPEDIIIAPNPDNLKTGQKSRYSNRKNVTRNPASKITNKPSKLVSPNKSVNSFKPFNPSANNSLDPIVRKALGSNPSKGIPLTQDQTTDPLQGKQGFNGFLSLIGTPNELSASTFEKLRTGTFLTSEVDLQKPILVQTDKGHYIVNPILDENGKLIELKYIKQVLPEDVLIRISSEQIILSSQRERIITSADLEHLIDKNR